MGINTKFFFNQLIRKKKNTTTTLHSRQHENEIQNDKTQHVIAVCMKTEIQISDTRNENVTTKKRSNYRVYLKYVLVGTWKIEGLVYYMRT